MIRRYELGCFIWTIFQAEMRKSTRFFGFRPPTNTEMFPSGSRSFSRRLRLSGSDTGWNLVVSTPFGIVAMVSSGKPASSNSARISLVRLMMRLSLRPRNPIGGCPKKAWRSSTRSPAYPPLASLAITGRRSSQPVMAPAKPVEMSW